MYVNCAHMDLYLMPLRLCTAHVDRYVDQGHEEILQIKVFVSEKRTFCNSIIVLLANLKDHGGVIQVPQPTVWGLGNLTRVLSACLIYVCWLGQLILMHLLQFQIRAVITNSFKMQKSDCVH